MKTLITGGAGYLGSHLVRRLADAEREVAVLDSFAGDEDPHAAWSRLAGTLRERRFIIRVGDVRDRAAVAETIAALQPDAIVHLARAGDSDGLARAVEVNQAGALVVAAAAAQAGVERLVVASSADPEAADHLIATQMEALLAASLAGEARPWTTVLRFAPIYGPGRPLAPSPGPDPIWIDDAVDAVVLALDADLDELLRTYNVAGLTETPTIDVSAARNDLGFLPRVSVEEGMRRLAEEAAG